MKKAAASKEMIESSDDEALLPLTPTPKGKSSSTSTSTGSNTPTASPSQATTSAPTVPDQDDAEVERTKSLMKQVKLLQKTYETAGTVGSTATRKVPYQVVRAAMERLENAKSVAGVDGHVHGLILSIMRPEFRRIVHERCNQAVVDSD
jgi:hypothetical protein